MKEIIKTAGLIFIGLVAFIIVCMIGVVGLELLGCPDYVVLFGGTIWILIVLACILSVGIHEG